MHLILFLWVENKNGAKMKVKEILLLKLVAVKIIINSYYIEYVLLRALGFH